jgi:hypothetical protein
MSVVSTIGVVNKVAHVPLDKIGEPSSLHSLVGWDRSGPDTQLSFLAQPHETVLHISTQP